jgi:hypothetical protein
LNHKWSDYVPNSALYNGLEPSLSEFDYWRSNLVLLGTVFEVTNLSATDFYGITPNWSIANVSRVAASNANYSRQLLKAIGRVEGLVTSDEEVRKLMLDREAWRSRIKMIVATNKEVDSSKRVIEKIGASKLEVLLLLFSII